MHASVFIQRYAYIHIHAHDVHTQTYTQHTPTHPPNTCTHKLMNYIHKNIHTRYTRKHTDNTPTNTHTHTHTHETTFTLASLYMHIRRVRIRCTNICRSHRHEKCNPFTTADSCSSSVRARQACRRGQSDVACDCKSAGMCACTHLCM